MYLHRDDRDEYLQFLAERFPKCFFTNPKLRRPLKKNIAVDLERTGVIDSVKLGQVISWYENHYSYRYSHIAGSSRVDLDGNNAGTITPQEEAEARKWIAARKREVAEQQASLSVSPVIVAKPQQTIGTKQMAKSAAFDPLLRDIQEGVVIVNGLLTDKTYASQSATLATTALRCIVDRAETLIQSLTIPSN